MCDEPTDHERAAIKPMQPNKLNLEWISRDEPAFLKVWLSIDLEVHRHRTRQLSLRLA